MAKTGVALKREARKVLNFIHDDEFTGRQFLDTWLNHCSYRLAPHAAGVKSLLSKIGCKKTGRKWKGHDLYAKPTR